MKKLKKKFDQKLFQTDVTSNHRFKKLIKYQVGQLILIINLTGLKST
jgi:hypothetical protein